MTTTTTVLAAAVILAAAVASLAPPLHGYGVSASTYAAVFGNPTVCGIIAEHTFRKIRCWNSKRDPFDVEPSTISYDYIAGSLEGFCAITSGGSSLLCWNSSLVPTRIYSSDSVLLDHLTYGDGQFCALTNGTRSVRCWRERDPDPPLKPPADSEQLDSVSSGYGFNCGVLTDSGGVVCWGSDAVAANQVQSQFANVSMSSIVVGGNYACGFARSGHLICETRAIENNYPSDSPPFEFFGVVVGENHACAVRRRDGTVVCWGFAAAGDFNSNVTDGVSFVSLVAGVDYTCGLVSSTVTVICWGPGWPGDYSPGSDVPLPAILPGPCVDSSKCSECTDPLSFIYCSGNGSICRPCNYT